MQASNRALARPNIDKRWRTVSHPEQPPLTNAHAEYSLATLGAVGFLMKSVSSTLQRLLLRMR